MDVTDVTVVDTKMPTTMAVTDKKTPTKPTEKTMTQRPTKDDVVFEVTATLQDEKYTEELADSNSDQFKELSKKLTDILTDIFKTNVPGFRWVEIISFRKGSVICVFQVITEESKASTEEIKDVLTEASKNEKAGKYIFKNVNVEQETAEATKRLSTGIASICSETSSKAKTSQILRLSTRESRFFRMDTYVTSSSLFSTTAPISKSPQPTSLSTTSATSFKLKLSQVPANPVGLRPQPLFRQRLQNPRSVLKGSMLQ